MKDKPKWDGERHRANPGCQDESSWNGFCAPTTGSFSGALRRRPVHSSRGNSSVLPMIKRFCAGVIPSLLLLLLFPRLLGAQSAPAPAPAESGELLQFLDSTTLHGELVAADSGHGLRWRHPAARSDFDLSPAHVDRILFSQANPTALTPSCHIRFAGGDDLYGSLLSLDADNVQFNTWFGGTLKIPRSAVQTITFLPKGYSIVYEGPTSAADWKITAGQQYANSGVRVLINGANVQGNNLIVLGNGQVVFQNGAVNGAGANLSGPTNWTYRDGSFVTAGTGTLGRNLAMSGSCTVEFDLACNGSFNLLMGLYSPTADLVGAFAGTRQIRQGNVILNFNGAQGLIANGAADPSFNRASIMVELSDTQAYLLRSGRNYVNPDTHGDVMTNFDTHGRTSHVTLSCNKDEGSLTLIVDGITVRKWTEITGFDDMGDSLVFQNQAYGSTITLSHIKVSKWDGKYEPEIGSGGAVGSDMVSFINRDRAGGKIEGLTDGKLVLVLGENTLHIPAERVRQIDFAESSAVREPRGPWEVRAVFPGRGSVSFRLERWDDQAVVGRSALFGLLAFQPSGIRELQFNLDQPRTEPSARVEDEYDVLDQ